MHAPLLSQHIPVNMEEMEDQKQLLLARSIERRMSRVRETPDQLAQTLVDIDSMLTFIEEYGDRVKEAFACLDKQGKGSIQTKDLVTLLRYLGLNPTEDETDDIINESDVVGDEEVGFIEFVEQMKKRWYEADETFRLAFEMFDSDGSGNIDANELKHMMEEQGQMEVDEGEIDDIIARVDKNGDGVIDLEEFMDMLREC